MDKFVARQPIFDRHQKVFGYELLFRSGLESQFFEPDGDAASMSILAQSIFPIDLDTFTRGRKAFINFTRESLIGEYATLLTREQIVLELLESIEPDPEVMAACYKLKHMGYLIALDDFTDAACLAPLTAIADIIKVDFQATNPSSRKSLAAKYIPKGIQMLAEKVETREQFQEAYLLGYTYFQGYFFCKPQLLTGRDLPGFKRRYIQILRAVNQPDPEISDLEEIMKPEVSLCYKLLRYMNSAYFGFRGDIKSIQHALKLLGLSEFKKWVSLVVTAALVTEKPDELFISSAIRARFCELTAPRIGMPERSADLYLMGLFSLLEPILDYPLSSILADIPISDDIRDALLGSQNRIGDLRWLCIAYEQGRWEPVSKLAAELGVPETDLAGIYISSVKWAKDLFQA